MEDLLDTNDLDIDGPLPDQVDVVPREIDPRLRADGGIDASV